MREMYSINTQDDYWSNFWNSLDIEQEVNSVKKIYTYPLFLKYLPKKGKILEAGCGLGRIVIYFRRKGYDVVGIENNKLAVDRLKRYNSGLPIKFGDISKLPYKDKQFKAVIAMGVVSWFKKPDKAMRELARVLDKGGILLIQVPCNCKADIFWRPYKFIARIKFIRKVFKKKTGELVFAGMQYKPKEFKGLLNKHGFEIIKISPQYPKGGFWQRFPMFRSKQSKKLYKNKKLFLQKATDGETAYTLNLPGRIFYKFLLRYFPFFSPIGIFVVAIKR